MFRKLIKKINFLKIKTKIKKWNKYNELSHMPKKNKKRLHTKM